MPILTPEPERPGETGLDPAPPKEIPGKSKLDTIPPCPPEDPTHGDKTPEVVAWWFKHKPEEAEVKYAGRKFTRPE